MTETEIRGGAATFSENKSDERILASNDDQMGSAQGAPLSLENPTSQGEPKPINTNTTISQKQQ